jgi:hypothetical protein
MMRRRSDASWPFLLRNLNRGCLRRLRHTECAYYYEKTGKSARPTLSDFDWRFGVEKLFGAVLEFCG